LRSDSVV